MKVCGAFGGSFLVRSFIAYKEFDRECYIFSIACISNEILEALVIMMCVVINGG
jgi:hypothetical protein